MSRVCEQPLRPAPAAPRRRRSARARCRGRVRDAVEDVDVGEIRDGVHIRHGAGESDLASVRRVQADHASGRLDQGVRHVAWSSECPVRLLAQEAMDGFAIDPRRVVVELVSGWRRSSHAAILADRVRSRAATVRSRCASPSCSPWPCRSRSPTWCTRRERRRRGGRTTSARLAWIALCVVLLAAILALVRVPSAAIPPAAGLLAAGVLGNTMSAAWNGLRVPNPIVVEADRAIARVQPRRHLGARRASCAHDLALGVADPQP